MKFCFLTALLLISSLSLPADWLTFGHDPQRSGWATEETKLSSKTAQNLELKWSISLDNLPLALNSLTAPLVARDVVTANGAKTIVFVAGSSNRLFAIDAASGTLVWNRTFQSYVSAKADSFFLCPNAINATPVIDRGQNLIFALAYDGRLFGLDLATGAIRFGPFQFTPPFSKSWSLNLSSGFIYTTTSQGCGGDRSGVYSMHVDDPLRHASNEMVMRNGSGAGLWSRGGTVIGQNGELYVSTGDGLFNPATGDFGSSFVALSATSLKVLDYFTPANFKEVNEKDLDLPSGGSLGFSYNNENWIVGGGKESVAYLLTANHLGSEDHHTPRYVSQPIGNAAKDLAGKGFWGSPALWKDESGQPWIYMSLWSALNKQVQDTAPNNGSAPHGSVVAFKVEQGTTGAPSLKLAWISPDVDLPDAPAVAAGVVFVMATGENTRQEKQEGKTHFTSQQDWKQNLLTTEERSAATHPAELMALDAKTGKLLYRSYAAMKSWHHFGGVAIDDGKVFTVDHSSTLYCFGLHDMSQGIH